MRQTIYLSPVSVFLIKFIMFLSHEIIGRWTLDVSAILTSFLGTIMLSACPFAHSVSNKSPFTCVNMQYIMLFVQLISFS